MMGGYCNARTIYRFRKNRFEIRDAYAHKCYYQNMHLDLAIPLFLNIDADTLARRLISLWKILRTGCCNIMFHGNVPRGELR